MPLGAADLSVDTDTLVYTCPASKKASVNVSFCARTQAADIRLAVTSGGAPTATDYIEYGLTLQQNGVLERTQIWLEENARIYARASATGVSVVVYGPEEDA